MPRQMTTKATDPMNERPYEVFTLSDEDVAKAEAALEAASARGVSIADYYAGCLTHLYPDPEDTRRFLDELRADWDELERRLDEPWGP